MSLSHAQAHAKSRARNNARAEAQEVRKAEGKAFQYASWENKTTDGIARREVEKRSRILQAREEEALVARRHRLAALLGAEDAALTKELTNSFETMDQRRMRLVNEAQRLQQNREKQRQAEVARLREMQWKESVDEIRTHQSRAITMQIANDRVKQLKEKEQRKQAVKDQDVVHQRTWEEARQKKLARELKEKDEVARSNEETRRLLEAQLEERELLRRRAANERNAENAEEQVRWRAGMQAEEDKQRRRKEKAAQIEREVQKYNQHKKSTDGQKAAIEAAEDMRLLTAAMTKEANKAKAEADAKEKRRREMIEYQEILQEMMIKEEQDDSYLEELLKAEADKEWAKREAKWGAEAAARTRLMQEVDISRKQQMAMKGTNKEVDKVKDMEFAMKMKRELEVRNQEQAAKEGKVASARLRNAQFVQAQIAEKEQNKDQDKQREAQRHQLEGQADQLYAKKLAGLYDEPVTADQDYKRKKVQWYY